MNNQNLKPTLIILAAGLSSRYKKGLKQLDPMGPSGEFMMDYAIYDAIRTGFGKVVFVIQKNFRSEFENLILSRYHQNIECVIAVQDLHDLPGGLLCPVNRKKPWGTGHAVWVTRDIITESFAVINADDFYGFAAFKSMAEFLKIQLTGTGNMFTMIGYYLRNTLSDHGSVSRGICQVENGMLNEIVERPEIIKTKNHIYDISSKKIRTALSGDLIVSMNFWGFGYDLYNTFEQPFFRFYKENKNNPDTEFYLPQWINYLITEKDLKVKVISSPDQWIGVTYANDRAGAIERINTLIKKGEYPTKIF